MRESRPLDLFQYQGHVEPVFSGSETTSEDKWHEPWSEPVRQKIKPALAIALMASGLFFTPQQAGETATQDKWYEPFSEPVRHRDFGVALQRTTTIDTVQIATRSNLGWYAILSEPVRLKRGLGPWLQQSDALQVPIVPPANRLIQWFAPLSEPVRQRIGLKAWLQQTLAWPPRVLPPANVTATMAATEVNADVALFGIQVYNPITPVAVGTSANVSIAEIPAQNSGAASIEET